VRTITRASSTWLVSELDCSVMFEAELHRIKRYCMCCVATCFLCVAHILQYTPALRYDA
jgi:hypothetical protein